MKKSMSELERLSPEEFREAEKTSIIVLLDQVRSGLNVGSIFRSADSFLIEKIYLGGYTPLPPHREILKSALGSTETVAWEHAEDLVPVIEQLKANGAAVYALEQVHNSITLQQFEPVKGQTIALVLGNEVSGVDERVIAACTGCIEIEQYGSKHSLNVSVCAGIALYDIAAKLRR